MTKEINFKDPNRTDTLASGLNHYSQSFDFKDSKKWALVAHDLAHCFLYMCRVSCRRLDSLIFFRVSSEIDCPSQSTSDFIFSFR